MRRILITILLGVALATLFVAPAQAVHSEVFQVSGGTSTQRALVTEALEKSSWDWRWGSDRYPSTKVAIAASHAGVWGDGTLTAAADLGTPYYYRDEVGAVMGVAYYPSGDVYLNAAVTDPARLRQLMAHEAAHARVMFVLLSRYEPLTDHYQTPPVLAWKEIVAPHFTPEDWAAVTEWHLNPIEAHAEWHRCIYLEPQYQQDLWPRTGLAFGDGEQVREFHWRWCKTPPYYDVPSADTELCAALYWRFGVIWQGYPDNTFRPHAPLLKRHVALICQRAGLTSPPWDAEYSPATRGEVREALPGFTWLEARWAEGITRSQLARLIWRTR